MEGMRRERMVLDMQGRWNFDLPSKHGDYGVFVGTVDGKGLAVLTEPNECGECLVVVHDNTDGGLTAGEREDIAKKAVTQTVYWNDIDCYHWMFDFKCGGHWCEMWHGNDDEPYYLAMHINVIE